MAQAKSGVNIYSLPLSQKMSLVPELPEPCGPGHLNKPLQLQGQYLT